MIQSDEWKDSSVVSLANGISVNMTRIISTCFVRLQRSSYDEIQKKRFYYFCFFLLKVIHLVFISRQQQRIETCDENLLEQALTNLISAMIDSVIPSTTGRKSGRETNVGSVCSSRCHRPGEQLREIRHGCFKKKT
jgi:hypothetical protein